MKTRLTKYELKLISESMNENHYLDHLKYLHNQFNTIHFQTMIIIFILASILLHLLQFNHHSILIVKYLIWLIAINFNTYFTHFIILNQINYFLFILAQFLYLSRPFISYLFIIFYLKFNRSYMIIFYTIIISYKKKAAQINQFIIQMKNTSKHNQTFFNNIHLLSNLNDQRTSQTSQRQFQNSNRKYDSQYNCLQKSNLTATQLDENINSSQIKQNIKLQSFMRQFKRTGSNKLVQKQFQVAYSCQNFELQINSSLPKKTQQMNKKYQQQNYTQFIQKKNIDNSIKVSQQQRIKTNSLELLIKDNESGSQNKELLKLDSKRKEKSSKSQTKKSNQNLVMIQKLQTKIHWKQSKNSSQQVQDNSNLFINKKMLNLENKSNKLLQKVFSIQQQIQKYSQTQQKDINPYQFQLDMSNLLFQTRSQIQQHKEEYNFNAYLKQQKQGIKKLNILGKNKVKMIEGLEAQIQNLQLKLNKKEQKIQSQQIQIAKKQIYGNFADYYKHKSHLLKQSKSQKFSFNKLKSIKNKNSKGFREQLEEDILSKNGDNLSKNGDLNNEQSFQKQLNSLKQQFNFYKQRTSKQLESYKQKLNQNIFQKEMLKKQLQQVRYQKLKQKIFSKKTIMTKRQREQKTSREFIKSKQQFYTSPDRQQQFFASSYGKNYLTQKNYHTQQEPSNLQNEPTKQSFTDFKIQLNLPKTQRIVNNDGIAFRDLQQFKDQLSVKYIEDNQIQQQLNRKIQSQQQAIATLQQKIQKMKLNHQDEIVNYKFSLQQKQKLQEELVDINEEKDKEIQYLKNQINDMNNYIIQCKQQNQHQTQALDQYKSLIQQFINQVGTLRNQVAQSNSQNHLLNQQIQEAYKINDLCQKQIQRIQKLNQSLKLQIKKLQLSQAYYKKNNQQNSIKSSFNINQQNSFKQIETALRQQIRMKQYTSKQMKQQNQKAIKQKQHKIQQMSQNLQTLRSSIDEKVDQQVNQGIRTFLRYRKNVNHIVHQIFKITILSQNKLQKSQKKLMQNQTVDLKFREIKITNEKIKMLTSRPKSDSDDIINISLRKILDSRFNFKFNQGKQLSDFLLIKFKVQICLKLARLWINIIKGPNESSINGLKVSIRKYPSLNPQNIYVVCNQNITKNISSSIPNHFNFNFQNLYQNYETLEFQYRKNQKKENESKNDKNLIYLSPQVLLSMNESQASYCWTLGVIIDQILNNRPFYSKIEDIVSRKENYKYEERRVNCQKVKTKAKQLLQKMVLKNHKQRPSLQLVFQKIRNILQDMKQQY